MAAAESPSEKANVSSQYGFFNSTLVASKAALRKTAEGLGIKAAIGEA